jgi:hypothetical protein
LGKGKTKSTQKKKDVLLIRRTPLQIRTCISPEATEDRRVACYFSKTERKEYSVVNSMSSINTFQE